MIVNLKVVLFDCSPSIPFDNHKSTDCLEKTTHGQWEQVS